jgi:hypothetical protein
MILIFDSWARVPAHWPRFPPAKEPCSAIAPRFVFWGATNDSTVSGSRWWKPCIRFRFVRTTFPELQRAIIFEAPHQALVSTFVRLRLILLDERR